MEPIDGRHSEEEVTLTSDPMEWLEALERLTQLCLRNRSFTWAIVSFSVRLAGIRRLMFALRGEAVECTDEQRRKLQRDVWSHYHALDKAGRLEFWPLVRLVS